MDNSSHDNKNNSHLLSDHDSIGPDSSIWVRPLRQLFKNGKPVGKVAGLRVFLNKHELCPLGMLTHTGKNRLVFWPVWPSGVNMVCGDEIVDIFDHITLEFPSEKTHVTAYDSNSKPIHFTRGWRTQHYLGSELRLWFTLLARASILRQHGMEMQRRVKVPKSDKDRRTDAFARFVQNLSFVNITLPPHDADFDYIYCGLFLAPDSITSDQLPDPGLSGDVTLTSQLDGWEKGEFEVLTTRFSFAQQTFCIATSCPSGKLQPDVAIGFPRQRAT